MNARRKLCLPVLVALPLCAANAAKVEMPKEGKLDFNYCFASMEEPVTVTDKLMFGAYKVYAAIHANPGGGPFDLQSSRCFGTYSAFDGKERGGGYCEITDADGDKWIMDVTEKNPFEGEWIAVGGSGKYTGMTGKGAYKALGEVPAVAPNTYARCHRNTGTYKLR